MAISICFFNHKGGVSKTTTTFNLGWALASTGKKVLMFDADAQCNLTGMVLGQNAVDDDKLSAFYSSREYLNAETLVNSVIDNKTDLYPSIIRGDWGRPYESKNPNLFLIAGHQDISELDSQIVFALNASASVRAHATYLPGFRI